MKQRKKSFGMRISAFVLSFAMVCTLLAGVNVVAFAADSDDELTDSVSVLRAYNPNNSEHLYTIDETEYNANVSRGYTGEGEAWKAPIYSETEVWRAYNPNSGEHMLASEAEVYALEAAGWQNEGFKMYSDDAMGTPIYRVFNPNSNDAGSHHYCGYEEAAGLVGLGWEWDNDGEPVIYGVAEEPPVIVVSITDVDQLTANSIWVEFDQDASLLVDQNDIAVSKADGTLTLPINKMEFDLDGMGATLTFAVPLEDDVDYVATLNDSEAGFTASVGEVDTVVVTTASAQKGVETPIEFVLYDEMGVDITSTVDVDATCSVDVDGNDIVSDTSVPSKATLTMNTVGEEASVVVTYNSGDSDAVDVVGLGTITCIPAEAVVGMPIYTSVKAADVPAYVNPGSEMAKFYLGLIDSEPITVVQGQESDTIYFCAANIADFTVYSYDEYEITSSNDDVVSVSDEVKAEGKDVAFKVTGNNAGSANIVVKATVNDVTTPYTIPVRVVEEGELDTITYTVDKTSLTNAIDADYYATSTIKAYDSNGIEITDSVNFDYEVTSGKIEDNDLDDTASTLLGAMDGGFTVTPNQDEAYYSAYASNGGKKVIKATVSEGEISKSKSINIQVNKIANGAWNVAGSTEQSVTYAVELTKSNVNASLEGFAEELTAGGSTEARLGAYVGGKFVGYVRVDDTDVNGGIVIGTATGSAASSAGAVTDSAVKVNASTGIDAGSLAFAVKYGNKYNTNMDLSGLGAGDFWNVIAGYNAFTSTDMFTQTLDEVLANNTVGDQGVFDSFTIMAFDPVAAKAGTFEYYADSAKSLGDVARPGAYTVTYAWKTADGKDTTKTATAKLTVGDVLGQVASAEKVTVLSRNVESLDIDGVKENLYAIADMNNNTSGHESIINLCDADFGAHDFDVNGYVKYAVVEEYINSVAGVKVNFYIPINTTFKTK